MDLGSIFLGLALLVVVGFIVARPLLGKAREREPALSGADHLLSERDRVLTQLRDLDFDRATGKINDDDYAAQRSQLVVEGTGILKQLDALGVASSSSAPADDIEAAVAALRARRAEAERAATKAPSQAGLACAVCGEEVLPKDRFCPKCGSPLTSRQGRPAEVQG